MEEFEIDQELVEELKESKKKFGALSPVILDAFGNIVEGHHRKRADARWPQIVYKEIRTEEDRILYAIAFNWHRREKSEAWKKKQLSWLAKQGYTIDQIVEKTGLNRRTVYRYLPSELKGPEPSQFAGSHTASDSLSLNLKPQDMTVGKARELLDTPAGQEVLENAVKERLAEGHGQKVTGSEEGPSFADEIRTREGESESEKGPITNVEPSTQKPKPPEALLTGFEWTCPECGEKYIINHIDYPGGGICKHALEACGR